jgi:hypothetical protein
MSYYLENFTVRETLLSEEVPNDLKVVVVIPCCNEEDLLGSLQSLFECDIPNGNVEVITVINASEIAEEAVILQNEKAFLEAKEWSVSHQKENLNFYFIQENSLPKKHAGVGLARKIGMDEAVRRFESIYNPDGIILCFDADANCEKNYLIEVEKHFKNNPKSPACSIHFEHPIAGTEFSENIYKGIIQYELHLRVYKNGLKYAGLPYAYHTIGSSMAVRSSIYQKQNGMNKRKAGEDFYFLQKLIPLGGFTELTSTKVIPSPRVSDRVPFGTGKAMQNWIDDDEPAMQSYALESYHDLKQFNTVLKHLYKCDALEIPITIKAFLESIAWQKDLENIRKNSTSEDHFIKLFYNWFNAFKVLKYMHFARDNYYPDVSVSKAGNGLLETLNKGSQEEIVKLLEVFRQYDKIT